MSDDISAVLNLTTAPPLPVIPEAWHGRKVVALVATSVGPVEEGVGHVARLRAVAEPVADLLGPMPYAAIQTLFDPLWEKGVHAMCLYPSATTISLPFTVGGFCMPFIQVKVVAGVFTAEQKREIVERLTEAMVAIQGEGMRQLTWCVVEEVPDGAWGIGGQAITADDVRALGSLSAV